MISPLIACLPVICPCIIINCCPDNTNNDGEIHASTVQTKTDDNNTSKTKDVPKTVYTVNEVNESVQTNNINDREASENNSKAINRPVDRTVLFVTNVP